MRYSNNTLSTCSICSVAPEDAWILSDFVVAVPHASPAGSCHVIVAPRRHVANFYDLDVQEQRMVWDALAQLRERITASLKIDGFDVGFADAPNAGEGSGHAFVHLIPRIPGENVERPRGAEWVDMGLQ